MRAVPLAVPFKTFEGVSMRRIIIVLSLVFAASRGFAHKVRVDFDDRAQFSHYKTYRWRQIESTAQNPLFPNQLMQERIISLVEEALAAKGLKRVTMGGDLLIDYGINVTEQPQFTTLSQGCGPGWEWDCGFSTTTVQTIVERTLVLDMVDANQNKLVFQATATRTLSSKPEKNAKELSEAVNEIFLKFPPRP
jgi:hypothetical protein